MRARNLKPGFFKNESLADLPFAGRILFQGLWCLADREGRLEDRPKRIKAEVFPYDNLDVAPMLDELAVKGFIVRYQALGQGCIWIPHFKDHQNPHPHEAQSTLPEYVEQNECHGMSLHVTKCNASSLNPSSLNPDLRQESSLRSDSSGEVPKPAPSPVLLTVPLIVRDGHFDITQQDVDQWQDTFPAVDVLAELKRLRQWNLDNPKNRKTRAGFRSHVSKWLGAEQNKAGRQGNAPGPAPRTKTTSIFDLPLSPTGGAKP